MRVFAVLRPCFQLESAVAEKQGREGVCSSEAEEAQQRGALAGKAGSGRFSVDARGGLVTNRGWQKSSGGKGKGGVGKGKGKGKGGVGKGKGNGNGGGQWGGANGGKIKGGAPAKSRPAPYSASSMVSCLAAGYAPAFRKARLIQIPWLSSCSIVINVCSSTRACRHRANRPRSSTVRCGMEMKAVFSRLLYITAPGWS